MTTRFLGHRLDMDFMMELRLLKHLAGLCSELQSLVVGHCEGSWFIKAVNVVL